MLDFTDITFSCLSQQRMLDASTAERVKTRAMEYSDADAVFQQLDKLRTIYDDYVKLVEGTIPLAEKNLNQRLEEESQKAQTFDDVSFLLLTAYTFIFACKIIDSGARGHSKFLLIKTALN